MPCLLVKGQLLNGPLAAASEPFAKANSPGQAVPDVPIFMLPAASGSKLHFEKTIGQRGHWPEGGPPQPAALRTFRY
jgi:hypothetical protein